MYFYIFIEDLSEQMNFFVLFLELATVIQLPCNFCLRYLPAMVGDVYSYTKGSVKSPHLVKYNMCL